MSGSNWVHLDVQEVVAGTDLALLLRLADEDGTEVWVPTSQIADADRYEVGDQDLTICVSRWIAEQKGLA